MSRYKRLVMSALIGLCLTMMTFPVYADEYDDDWEESWEDYEDDYYEEDDYDEEDYDEDEGWYQDERGRWHYKKSYSGYSDGMYKISGKYYYFDDRGIMVTNTFIHLIEGLSEIYYFGADGARVTGWIQDAVGKWAYADPDGAVMDRGIINDNGNYYIIDKYAMQTGIYNMEWDTSKCQDITDIYNVRNTDLPYKVGWGTVDLGASGGVTLDKLPKSNGMTTEYYNQLMDELNNTEANNNSTTTDKFAIADSYIGTAMAENGIYNYQLISKEHVDSAPYGGFTAVYKVYIPSQKLTTYLRITFSVDIISGQPIYHDSELV